MTRVAFRWLLAGVVALSAGRATAQDVFSTDFESGLPPEFSAPGSTVQGVEGYAGIGTPGNQFGGNFLRYDSTSVVDTTLTLTGLPPHDTLSLGFLLAVIDSWDGTELFQVLVDGVPIFSNTFELAITDTSSYVAPPGALLSSGTDLGFSLGSYYAHDRAYDLSADPAFSGIPHTADSVTIIWRLDAAPGGGASFWQGDGDESWGIDNVAVSVSVGPVTTTTTAPPTTVTTFTTTTTTVTTSTTTTTVPPGETLSGKKLLLKWRADDPGKSGIDLLSKDADATLGGGAGSADDPTVAGGSLRVLAVGGDGFDDTYDLPAKQWRYASKKKPENGYKFSKGDPVKTILVKPGKQVKVLGKGAGLGHSLATEPTAVLVELRLGGLRYCFEFGGTTKFTAGKKLLAKNAQPGTCPP